MKTREITIPGEYVGVSKELYRRGVGHLAHAAHMLPITPDEAQQIVSDLLGSNVSVKFRGYRGRALRSGKRVTLPAASGVRSDGAPYLRLGIVLHEVAHILTFRKHPHSAPHGEHFCYQFAKLLREF